MGKHTGIRLASHYNPRVPSPNILAVVITVSDSRSAGAQQDFSGPAVARILGEAGFTVGETVIVPDDQAAIEAELLRPPAMSPRKRPAPSATA